MELHSKNEEFEEKICKKLGQLTRVIFYLNVKSEEQDSLVRGVVGRFQKELDRVVVDANRAIEKKNQKLLMLEKIQAVEQQVGDLEKRVLKENTENLGVIRTLEKEVGEARHFGELEKQMAQQRSEMKDLDEIIQSFQVILANKNELLDKKIRIKEEQFEMYIQESNRKYQRCAHQAVRREPGVARGG